MPASSRRTVGWAARTPRAPNWGSAHDRKPRTARPRVRRDRPPTVHSRRSPDSCGRTRRGKASRSWPHASRKISPRCGGRRRGPGWCLRRTATVGGRRAARGGDGCGPRAGEVERIVQRPRHASASDRRQPWAVSCVRLSGIEAGQPIGHIERGSAIRLLPPRRHVGSDEPARHVCRDLAFKLLLAGPHSFSHLQRLRVVGQFEIQSIFSAGEIDGVSSCSSRIALS